jgi:O-antigen ligase
VSFGFGLVALSILLGAMGIAAAITIAGVLAAPGLTRMKQVLPLEFPFASFLVFIAWAWASTSWSPLPQTGQAWKMALGLPLYCLFAYGVWSLRGQGRLLVLYVALGSLLVMVCLFSLEAIFGIVAHFTPEGNERRQMMRDASRGLSALICAGPAAWAFLSMLIPGWRGVAASALFAVLSFVIAWRFGLAAGMIAVPVAASLFAIGWFFPRTTVLGVGLGAVGLFLLAPMMMSVFLGGADVDQLPFSWAIRIENWQYAVDRIADKPLFGWGLDASRSFTDTYQMHGYDLPYISMHPHNVGLQLWLETGFVGALLFSGSVLALAVRVSSARNLSRAQGAAIAAASGAILVFCTLSYGAWQEWFWGCVVWVAALSVLIGPEPRPGKT